MPVWLTGKLIVYALLALSLMAMIGTGVYKVKQWGAQEVQLKWDQAVTKQARDDEVKAALAATNREVDRGKTKVIYRTIKEQVATYIDRPIYRTDCFDADGLRDANAALLGKSPDLPRANVPVPATNPTR